MAEFVHVRERARVHVAMRGRVGLRVSVQARVHFVCSARCDLHSVSGQAPGMQTRTDT